MKLANPRNYLDSLCGPDLREPVGSNPIGLIFRLAGLDRDDLTANLIHNII